MSESGSSSNIFNNAVLCGVWFAGSSNKQFPVVGISIYLVVRGETALLVE